MSLGDANPSHGLPMNHKDSHHVAFNHRLQSGESCRKHWEHNWKIVFLWGKRILQWVNSAPNMGWVCQALPPFLLPFTYPCSPPTPRAALLVTWSASSESWSNNYPLSKISKLLFQCRFSIPHVLIPLKYLSALAMERSSPGEPSATWRNHLLHWRRHLPC